MTLKVLIIGRGDGPAAQVANGHTLEFTPHGGLPPDFLPLRQYDFVFMHLGPANPEAQAAIAAWSSQGWGGKVVGISGGEVPAWGEKLAIPTIEGVANRQNLYDLHWASVHPDFDGDAYELTSLLNQEQCEVLTSLAILCQGYLAVHAAAAGEAALAHAPEEVSAALALMGWGALGDKIRRNEPEAVLPSNLGSMLAEVVHPDWWLGAWGLSGLHGDEGWAALADSLEKECAKRGAAGVPGEIGDLLDVMRPAAGGGARESREIRPAAVSRAYLAITDLFSK